MVSREDDVFRDLFETVFSVHEDSPESQLFVNCGEPESEEFSSATGLSRFLYVRCECERPLGDRRCCVFDLDNFQFVLQGGKDSKFLSQWMHTVEVIYESANVL